MNTVNAPFVVAKSDYKFLVNNLEATGPPAGALKNSSRLDRLSDAIVLEESEFPWEVVRLYSRVVIRDHIARLNYTYTIVLPDEADHRKCLVSIFSPIGSAMFGHRRGEDIYWHTQKGKRYFTIMAITQTKQ